MNRLVLLASPIKRQEISSKYGPVISARFGQDDAVVLNDYESVHEALVKNIQHFNSRLSFYIVEQFTHGYGFGFADGHKKYLDVRNFSLSALRGLGIGRRTMETRVSDVLAQDLVKILEDLDQNPTDLKVCYACIDCYDVGGTVANVLCSVVFGKIYDLSDPEYQYAVQCSFDCFGDPENSKNVNFMFFYPIHTTF
ncbi:cytochrome P450 2C27-like [Ciona intestinalis]